MKNFALIYWFLCICLLSERTGIAQLIPVGTFDSPNGIRIEGMSFDPITGNLWMVEQGGNILVEVETTGSLVRTLTPAISPLEGLQVLPNGNLLAVASNGLVQELTSEGAIAPSGISLDVGFAVSDPEGVTFDSATNSVLVAAETDQALLPYKTVMT